MRRECPERFPHHRLQRKPLNSDPGVTHVLWCMMGLLTRGGRENVPGIPCVCLTRNFTYLARGLWLRKITLLVMQYLLNDPYRDGLGLFQAN